MYTIKKQKLLSPDVVLLEIYADALSDLPAQDAIAGKTISQGSTATVIQAGKRYILDGSGDWVEIPSSGGGTTDYALLTNKPQINGTTLEGDLDWADIGVDSELNAQSVNPVENAAVTAAINALADRIDKRTVCYGFEIDQSTESDPYECVTYTDDAVGMNPAKMGESKFDWGSWKGAFFMPRPCMLKFDGTVDYYLDPNDYSKKLDGTASDYNDLSYQGNVMIEFPKIWWAAGMTEDGKPWFKISNKKLSEEYHCWSNIDSQNNEIEYFYMAAYNGCIYDGKMRSISGLQLKSWSTTAYSASNTYAVGDEVNYNGRMWKCVTAVETAEAFDLEKWEQFAFNGNTDGTQEVNACLAMNENAAPEWYIDVWADRVLINMLLTLIGKSPDTQGVFGRGLDSGGQTAKEAYVTGTLDDKGLFYGTTANGNAAVKVFGMENFWSCVWHRTAGLVGAADGYLYKMTYGNADESTATAYNSNGSGYRKVTMTKPAEGYVSKVQLGGFGFVPEQTAGSSSTRYCDYYYNGNGFAVVGGYANYGLGYGSWCVNLNYSFGNRGWGVAAAPSCKPLA